LHVISLAHLSIIYARGWAANSWNARVRLQAQLEEAQTENGQLREELRIKDARMSSLEPHRRPHYRPTERLAILELRAAIGWSTAQTAKRFLVQPATIASWMKRIDEGGKGALLQTHEPVNKFPEFVRYIVRRLKVLCPTAGKKRIAQYLARSGVHLGVTTVKRILREKGKPPQPAEKAIEPEVGAKSVSQPVTAKHPNNVWHVDLTLVPTTAGFWAPWIPWAFPQLWPFSWWVACIMDHFSRRVMGFAVFRKEPNSAQVKAILSRTMRKVKATPKYLICDKGGQLWCPGFKEWCKGKGIDPRYSSTGSIRANAIIERFFRSCKEEWLRRIAVSLRHDGVRRQIELYLSWYAEYRPHQGLGGQTPNEVYYNRAPANEEPRFEPRKKWPRDSLCAFPQAKVKGRRGTRLELAVTFLRSHNQLPVVELKKAA
jgi:transposase InsO family protein